MITIPSYKSGTTRFNHLKRIIEAAEGGVGGYITRWNDGVQVKELRRLYDLSDYDLRSLADGLGLPQRTRKPAARAHVAHTATTTPADTHAAATELELDEYANRIADIVVARLNAQSRTTKRTWFVHG